MPPPWIPKSTLFRFPVTSGPSSSQSRSTCICLISNQHTARPVKHVYRSAASYSFTKNYATGRNRQSPTVSRIRKHQSEQNKVPDEEGRPGLKAHSCAFDPDFPTSAIMSAHGAKVLPFGPVVAARIIDCYLGLRGEGAGLNYMPNTEHGERLCNEFGISPSSLFLLGYILSRSGKPKAGQPGPYYGVMADFLELASRMGVATAMIYMYLQLRATVTGKNTSTAALARRELLEKKYWARLDELVKKTGHAAASHVLAETYQEREAYAQAKRLYRQAGEGGIGDAWLRLGLIYKMEGKNDMAKESFKRAMEHDVPEGYYEFVLLDYPVLLKDEKDGKLGPPSKEHYFYLLKAASSGYLPAAHALGQYFDVHEENPDVLMAKEWYMLAASSGKVDSMLKMAKILRREGDVDFAEEWERHASGAVEGEAVELPFEDGSVDSPEHEILLGEEEDRHRAKANG